MGSVRRAITLSGGLGVLGALVLASVSILEPERYLFHGLYWLAARTLLQWALCGLVVGWIVGAVYASLLGIAARNRSEASLMGRVIAGALAAGLAIVATGSLAGWDGSADAAASGAVAGVAALGLIYLLERTRTRALWGALLAAAVLMGWAGERLWQPRPAGPNLLLVTIDTLRADRLGCYGYRSGQTPNIDAIARQGTLWEAAIASAPVTLPAISSVMTGVDPHAHGARYNGFYELRRDVVTLAELLANRGYETGAVVGNFALDSRFGIAQGFASYDDQMTQHLHSGGPPPGVELAQTTWWTRHHLTQPTQRLADEITTEGLEWLERTGDRPFFLWLHYMDPHKPYSPPPAYLRSDLYDGELAFVDAEVGRFLAGYEVGFPDADTLLVVTADHGESLGEHGLRGHVFAVYEQMLRVPLIMRRPGVLEAGRRIAEPIGSRDVAVEILNALGFDGRFETFGRDASAVAAPGRWKFSETYEPYINRDERPHRSVRGERWKLIRQGTGEEELYDLASDPGELLNLVDASPERADSLRSILERVAGPAQEETRSVDPDTLQRLKDLGYVN